MLGYEFPEGGTNGYDANWLVVRIRAKPPDDSSWEVTHPSLLTSEVAELAAWLDRLADDEHAPREQDFTEPNLSFEVVGRSDGALSLRAYFELESRPPWAFSDEAGARDLWLDLDLGSDDLRSAAESLRDDLSRFPPRPAL